MKKEILGRIRKKGCHVSNINLLDRQEECWQKLTDPETNHWYRTLLTLQNELSYATYQFYRQRRIKTLFLPVTTGAISSPVGLGSDSSPVQVEIAAQSVYLADSMQFYLEYGCRFEEQGCFYLMPSFRGEQADRRHLCQFYHSEAEIPGSFSDIRRLVEDYILYLSDWLMKHCTEEIIEYAGSTQHLLEMCGRKSFPVVFWDEAVAELSTLSAHTYSLGNGLTGITSKGEQYLIHKFGGAVWLCYMDERIVPFYQANDGKGHAVCGDLLFGIGEVVGAGQRCIGEEDIVASLKLHHVSPEEYQWYIDMKKQFPMLTSGFGMGTERFLLWVLQHDDIRDCQLIPRFNGRKEYI